MMPLHSTRICSIYDIVCDTCSMQKPFWLPQSGRLALQNERVLFHYNGHGVPRPTMNGEIWVFNKSYTQYIPMSIYDLQAWLGTPCIFVFDCSAAGLIVNSFKAFAEQKPQVGACCTANPVSALHRTCEACSRCCSAMLHGMSKPKQTSHAMHVSISTLATKSVDCHMSLHARALPVGLASAGFALPSQNSSIRLVKACNGEWVYPRSRSVSKPSWQRHRGSFLARHSQQL